MNKYLVLLWLLPIFYAGSVLGTIMQCYSMSTLKEARRLAVIIPFMQIDFFVYLLKLQDNCKWRMLRVYLFHMPSKNVVFAQVVSEVILEYKRSHPLTSYERIRTCIRIAHRDVSTVVGRLAYA